MTPWSLRPLGEGDAEAVQGLLERTPEYSRRAQGRESAPGDGAAVLTQRPEGVDPGAKTVHGLFSADATLRGVCDVILHWPRPGLAHIGLLLVDGSLQERGLGRLLHESVSAQLRALEGIETLRLAVVAGNSAVVGFWETLGYRPWGEPVRDPSGCPERSTQIYRRPLRGDSPGSEGIHHVELWTADLEGTDPAWQWLLGALGWREERVQGWDQGRIWRRPGGGSYLVREQSPDVRGHRAERLAPGMNHLALHAPDGETLETLHADATGHGWEELFAEAFPHAGGPGSRAWYGVDPEGVEVEVVAPAD